MFESIIQSILRICVNLPIETYSICHKELLESLSHLVEAELISKGDNYTKKDIKNLIEDYDDRIQMIREEMNNAPSVRVSLPKIRVSSCFEF